jgi:hypothetical protein
MACLAKEFGLMGGYAPSRESATGDAFSEKRRRYLHFRGSKTAEQKAGLPENRLGN